MIRLLLIGDRHNSETIPSSRIDDYRDTCEKKDNEIISLAKKYDVSAILHPGDFWTDADKKLKNDFIAKVANKWNNIYTDTGRHIPLIGIAGNHDLIGENASSMPATTTGLLDSLGIFKLVSRENPFIVEKDGKRVVITGNNYHRGMDKPEYISDYIIDEHLGDVHIHIVHGMLENRNLGPLIRHTIIDNINSTKADITFCGHDHNGFGIVKSNNKLFINPGAVVRLTASNQEMTRDVGVVLVSIDDGIKCEFIKLKSALPASEVLDRSSIDRTKEIEKYTQELKEKVESLKLGHSSNFDDILDSIYTQEKIPDNIKSEIKESLDKRASTKTVSVGNKVPEQKTITKIKVVNFQSHRNTEIELDKNFNVIVGESRQGKSAILRALRWVFENKPSGKSFIKTGEKETLVELTFSNGMIIQRFIKGRENGYKVFMPDGTIEEGNTKMVSRIQELTGYTYLQADEKTSIPLNLLRQGDSWYLIGDGYSPTDRARIIGSIFDTNPADTTIKEIEKESGQLSAQTKSLEIESSNLELEISETKSLIEDKKLILNIAKNRYAVEKTEEYLRLCRDRDSVKKTLEDINSVFDEQKMSAMVAGINEKILKLLRIKKYLAIYSEAIESLAKQELIISLLPDTTEFAEKTNSIRELIKKHTSAIRFSETISAEKNKITSISKNIEGLTVPNRETVSEIDSSINKYVRIKNAFETIRRDTRRINAADTFIANSEIVNTYVKKKSDMFDVIANIQKISRITDRLSTSEKDFEKTSRHFIEVDEKLKSQIDNKAKILSETHICPTCYSTIDENTVKAIKENLYNA